MNVEQRRMASSDVAIQSKYLEESSRDTSERLNASLRGSETSPQEAIENRELIDSIVGLFPHCYEASYREVARAESAADVKWLQASIVWSDPSRNFLPTIFSMPSFVIGAQRHGRWTTTLLHGPQLDGDVNPYEANSHLKKRGAIQRADIWTGSYRKWHPGSHPTPGQELSVEQLDAVAGPGGYYITKESPDSKVLVNFGPRTIKGAVFGKLAVKGNLSKPVEGLTNEALASFAVFDHISGLALAFDKTEEVQAIINS